MCTVDGIPIQGPFSCDINQEILTNYAKFEVAFNDSSMSDREVGVEYIAKSCDINKCFVCTLSLCRYAPSSTLLYERPLLEQGSSTV